MLIALAMTSLGGALLAASDEEARNRKVARAVLKGLPTVLAGSYDWNDQVDTIKARHPFTLDTIFQQYKDWLDSHPDVDSDDYKHRVYAILLGAKPLTSDVDIQDDLPIHLVFQAEKDAAVITVHLDEGIYEVRTSGFQTGSPVRRGPLESEWRLQTAGIDELSEWGDRIRHHLKLTPSCDMEEIEPVVVAHGGTVIYVANYGFHLPD